MKGAALSFLALSFQLRACEGVGGVGGGWEERMAES